MSQDRIVELYRGDLWDCQLLESMLKDENIDCFLQNSVRSGYGPIVISAQLVQIMIRDADAERALEVLQRYESNIRK